MASCYIGYHMSLYSFDVVQEKRRKQANTKIVHFFLFPLKDLCFINFSKRLYIILEKT